MDESDDDDSKKNVSIISDASTIDYLFAKKFEKNIYENSVKF
jgi:hypothetical protein